MQSGPPPCGSGDFELVEPWTSVAGQYVLVCERAWLSTLVDSLFFLGFGVGAAGFGHLSDARGRRYALLAALVSCSVFTLASSAAFSLASYAALRALAGVSTGGIGVCAYVLAAEMIGSSMQGMTGAGQAIIFAVGEVTLSLTSLVLPSWRALTAATGILAGVYAVLVTVALVESPRWLIAHSRIAQASATLRQMAIANRWHHSAPDDDDELNGAIARALSSACCSLREDGGALEGAPEGAPGAALVAVGSAEDGASGSTVNGRAETKQHLQPACSGESSLLLLFRWPLRQWLLPSLGAWTACSLVYFGLSLSAADLGHNLHTSFALNSVIEIPAIMGGAYAIDHWGRRATVVGALLAGGVACIVCAVAPLLALAPSSATFVGLDTVELAALLGKFAVSAAFALIFVHTSEAFPTTVCNAAVGLCSAVARVGSVAAPATLYLSNVAASAPKLVFGGASLLAGTWALTLPETLGRPRLATVDDVVRLLERQH